MRIIFIFEVDDVAVFGQSKKELAVARKGSWNVNSSVTFVCFCERFLQNRSLVPLQFLRFIARPAERTLRDLSVAPW